MVERKIKETPKQEMPKSSVVTLLTPDYNGVATIEFTSKLGRSGVQGFVQPAILKFEEQELPIQAKSFYHQSTDDKGRDFSQDPNEEAERSYEALKFLSQRGFKILPFFGLATGKNGNKVLVMTDLTQGGRVEVYDEKDIHGARNVEQNVKGKKYIRNALETFENLANLTEIELGFIRTGLLQGAYDIGLGYGVQHIIVRNPKTNRGDIFVADVGEIDYRKSKYRDAINADKFLEIPKEEIARVLLQMTEPSDKFQNIPLKKEFQDLLYKSLMGVSLMEFIGETGKEVEFARKRFVRNNFDDHFMKLKLYCLRTVTDIEKYLGEPLFNKDNPEDLAYFAVMDSRLRYVMRIREAVDKDESIPDYESAVKYDSRGLPRMEFLDNFDESKGDKTVVQLHLENTLFTNQRGESLLLDVEVGWDEAYVAATSLGSSVLFLPSEIKSAVVGTYDYSDFKSPKLRNKIKLNPKKARIIDTKHGAITYVIDDKVLFYLHPRKGKLDDFLKRLTPNVAS